MANISTGRKSGFIIRGGAKRRETVCFGGASFAQVLAANTSVALVLALNAAALALRPFTVVLVLISNINHTRRIRHVNPPSAV